MKHTDNLTVSFAKRHIRFLTALSVLCHVLLFACLCFFGIFAAYYSQDSQNTVSYRIFSILNSYFTPLFLYFGYGILGYSIIRYGFKKSLGVIAVSLASSVFIVLSEFLCYAALTTFSLALNYYITSPGVPLISLCALLCQILILSMFCLFYRVFHTNKEVMQVGMTKRTLFRRRNALTAVYLRMALLCALFSLVPTVIESINNYRILGFFQNTAEFFTFISPFFEILINVFINYFAMCLIGMLATKKAGNLRQREKTK